MSKIVVDPASVAASVGNEATVAAAAVAVAAAAVAVAAAASGDAAAAVAAAAAASGDAAAAVAAAASVAASGDAADEEYPSSLGDMYVEYTSTTPCKQSQFCSGCLSHSNPIRSTKCENPGCNKPAGKWCGATERKIRFESMGSYTPPTLCYRENDTCGCINYCSNPSREVSIILLPSDIGRLPEKLRDLKIDPGVFRPDNAIHCLITCCSKLNKGISFGDAFEELLNHKDIKLD